MPPRQTERNIWTREMDGILLDALLHQMRIGNRPGGTFTTVAYNSVVKELEEKFPNSSWNKDRFRNRIKYLKGKFFECYDIFRNVSKSGWGFNPATQMWDLEDEVWNQLIESNPKAAEWKGKTIPFYEKLEELFSKDRATGDNAVTAAEVRARRRSAAGQHGQFGSMINDIDNMVSQDEVHIEGFSSFGIDSRTPPHSYEEYVSDASNVSVPQAGVSQGKGSKGKRKMDAFIASCSDMLSAQVEKFVTVMDKRSRVDPAEAIKCVEELDFDSRYKVQAAFYLSKNRADYDMLIAYPLEQRRSTLWLILVQAQIIGESEPSPYV